MNTADSKHPNEQSRVVSRFDLSGRVAWVVGGGGFLGKHVSRALAEHGAHVVVADLSETSASVSAQLIEQAGGLAEVAAIDVGDFVLIAAPVEVLTEVSLNVKKASSYKHTFIAGFTNGYMHYGPPAADYDKGGYEVTECFLGPQWQQVYEKTVNQILNKLR